MATIFIPTTIMHYKICITFSVSHKTSNISLLRHTQASYSINVQSLNFTLEQIVIFLNAYYV